MKNNRLIDAAKSSWLYISLAERARAAQLLAKLHRAGQRGIVNRGPSQRKGWAS